MFLDLTLSILKFIWSSTGPIVAKTVLAKRYKVGEVLYFTGSPSMSLKKSGKCDIDVEIETSQ